MGPLDSHENKIHPAAGGDFRDAGEATLFTTGSSRRPLGAYGVSTFDGRIEDRGEGVGGVPHDSIVVGGIVHPPSGRKNTTYIPLIVLAEPGG